MAEFDSHAGTGNYRCDDCGEVFPWINHASNEAFKALEAHECPITELSGRTW